MANAFHSFVNFGTSRITLRPLSAQLGRTFAVVACLALAACGSSGQLNNPPQDVGAAPRAADGKTVAVLSVSGAPGDGNRTLMTAMQQELAQLGIAAIETGSAGYRIEGSVTLGALAGGRQPVTITWNVRDPAGKSLGNVVQNNTIVRGALDGAWGTTADGAAKAAAKDVAGLVTGRKPSP